MTRARYQGVNAADIPSATGPGWCARVVAGEVAGVYEQRDMRGAIIPVITPGNVEQYGSALGGSHGTDVTGGMIGQVRQMLDVVQHHPSIGRIFSAAVRGNVQRLLIDPDTAIGTVIRVNM